MDSYIFVSNPFDVTPDTMYSGEQGTSFKVFLEDACYTTLCRSENFYLEKYNETPSGPDKFIYLQRCLSVKEKLFKMFLETSWVRDRVDSIIHMKTRLSNMDDICDFHFKDQLRRHIKETINAIPDN